MNVCTQSPPQSTVCLRLWLALPPLHIFHAIPLSCSYLPTLEHTLWNSAFLLFLMPFPPLTFLDLSLVPQIIVEASSHSPLNCHNQTELIFRIGDTTEPRI